jgi:hypothetical protein
MLLRQAQRHWWLVGLALLVGGLVGCRSSQPAAASRPASAPAETTRREDAIAGSDAERAKAALERDWPKGERRPAVPKRPPVVDQPRPGR